MIEYLKFHAAKALVEVAPFLLVFGLWSLYFIWQGIKQWWCPHTKYWENSRCHGICSKCGKDLGFIDGVRKKYGSGL